MGDISRDLAKMQTELSGGADDDVAAQFHRACLLVSERQPKYAGSLKRLLAYLQEGDRFTLMFTSQEDMRTTVADFLGYRKKQGLADTTLNVDRAAIKKTVRVLAKGDPRILAWLDQLFSEKSKSNPFKAVKVQPSVNEDKLLSPVEIRKLSEAGTEKDALFIDFLYRTGARVSEMLSIKLSDIKRFNGHALVTVTGKGDIRRDLPPVRSELIDRIQEHFQGEVYLFETRGKDNRNPYRREYVFQRIRKLGELVLGRHVHPHMLRHSSTTRVYQKTRSAKKAQHFAGHANASTTMNMYVHEAPTLEELDEIFDGMGPAPSKNDE